MFWPDSLIKQYRSPVGFTLIELLAGIAVLAILLLVLAGAFSNFATLTGSSTKRLETSQQSRAVFDRLSFDFAAGINHGGQSYQFRKNSKVVAGPATRNDAILFLADAKSTAPNSRLALIGYDVGELENPAAGGSHFTLMRHVQPFNWEDDATQPIISTAAIEQAVTPGVFRLELAFLKENGDIAADPPAAGDIQAVICALATVDEDTLAKLTDAEKQALIDALPDAENDSSPLSDWNINLPEIQALPPHVVRNIRFHQRYYRLK